jgi:hypothetical protein
MSDGNLPFPEKHDQPEISNPVCTGKPLNDDRIKFVFWKEQIPSPHNPPQTTPILFFSVSPLSVTVPAVTVRRFFSGR